MLILPLISLRRAGFLRYFLASSFRQIFRQMLIPWWLRSCFLQLRLLFHAIAAALYYRLCYAMITPCFRRLPRFRCRAAARWCHAAIYAADGCRARCYYWLFCFRLFCLRLIFLFFSFVTPFSSFSRHVISRFPLPPFRWWFLISPPPSFFSARADLRQPSAALLRLFFSLLDAAAFFFFRAEDFAAIAAALPLLRYAAAVEAASATRCICHAISFASWFAISWLAFRYFRLLIIFSWLLPLLSGLLAFFHADIAMIFRLAIMPIISLPDYDFSISSYFIRFFHFRFHYFRRFITLMLPDFFSLATSFRQVSELIFFLTLASCFLASDIALCFSQFLIFCWAASPLILFSLPDIFCAFIIFIFRFSTLLSFCLISAFIILMLCFIAMLPLALRAMLPAEFRRLPFWYLMLSCYISFITYMKADIFIVSYFDICWSFLLRLLLMPD